MRARALLAAMTAIGIAALSAGCGQLHASGTGSGTPKKLGCVTPRLRSDQTFTISDKDNGKTFCVVAGDRFYVFLHGSLTRKWSPIHPSSAAIAPRPSGVMALAVGVTGGYFQAARTGTATLTSARTPCKPGLGPQANGPVNCAQHNRFKVTVVIRGTM